MIEFAVTSRMITPASSTGFPTSPNFGILVPMTLAIHGPVSIDI